MTSPDCPICHGIGWHEAPVSDHFEPRLEIKPCPDCCSATPLTRGEALALTFIVLVFVAFLILGAR